MRHYLHLAALLLSTGAATTHAQVFNPDNLIGKPPAPPTHYQAAPSNNLQWLWQYTQPTPQGQKPALLADQRFSSLLKDQLKAPQAFWGTGVPLSEAAAAFLAGDGTIASTDNRHLTITGCVVDHCPQRGLLWLDLGRTSPVLIFAALRWDEQAHATNDPAATFTLWLFPNRDLDAHQLPEAFKSAIQTWLRPTACPGYPISNAVVVDTTGMAHIIGKLDAGLTPAFCSTPQPLTTNH
jgi:hypothetical protein